MVSVVAAHTARSRDSRIPVNQIDMAPIDKPCCIGTVKEGNLHGQFVELGPLTTYVTGTENAAGAAVLIIPDIFGFSIPNTR